MICQTWFDRPLSLAGRVMVKNGERIETRLVKVDRDLLMIPSLAIHMDRKVNEGRAVNKQIDMLPILSGSVKKQGEVRSLVAEELGLKDTDIYGWICSCITVWERSDGEATVNLSDVRDWMICSVHLHP